MADQSTSAGESLWLGDKARGYVRLFMWGCFYLTLLTGAWVVIGGRFFDLGLELRSILRPIENIHVLLPVLFGTLCFISAGIYFSDYQGAIEDRPDGFFDFFSLVWSRMTMIALAVIVCIMFFEVVSRYIFSAPTLWANELSLWIAAFVFLLAGLYSMQQRSHIRIYIIYDMFPRWLQKASDVLSVFLLWVFTISMIWGSYNEAVDKMQRMETFGTAWDPPIPATIKAGILIIIVMVAVQAVSNLIADWHKAPESHTPMDDIDATEIENIRKSIED